MAYQFHQLIETQFNVKLKVLRLGNDGEYLFTAFSSFLSWHGIFHQTTYAGTPEQNGVTKRKNMHLLEITHALLFHMHVPQKNWVDALQTATYLINRMPSCILGFKHPVELLSCSSLGSFLSLRVFGCICYVYVPKSDCSKLDPKALKCIFLGYTPNQKGYKCYHYPSTHRRIASMDVTLHETISFSPS